MMGPAAEQMHAVVAEVDSEGRVSGSSGEVDSRGLQITQPRDDQVAQRLSGDVGVNPNPPAALVGRPLDELGSDVEARVAGESVEELNARPSALAHTTGEDGLARPATDLRGLMGEIADEHGQPAPSPKR
jgi:hypothetical protein